MNDMGEPSEVIPAMAEMLSKMLADPEMMAKAIKQAHVMQLALMVDGEYTDPESGVTIGMSRDGVFSVKMPKKTEEDA